MIPTAEDFKKILLKERGRFTEYEYAIEFAKYHTREALKAAAEEAKQASITYQEITHTSVISPGSILCSYPLTNIK